MKPVESLRQGGGRAYALAAVGILAVSVLATIYQFTLVWAVARHGLALTPELLSPITIAFLAIGGMAGAQTLPNVAERWGGKEKP